MGIKIGIDLGTTFSAVGYINDDGKPTVIMDKDGQPMIPSVIYFGDEHPIVGDEAKVRQTFGDVEVASFFKRSMGQESFSEYFKDKAYSSTELSALLLKHLKNLAEETLGEEITEAVITVPAYFENKQREETIQAGKLAGLHVKAIINEPTAAALAYGIKQTVDQNLIVYDLGGGTFDVTVVEISASEIKVLATGGDHSLGGKDWDDRIINYVTELFYQEHGIDPLDSFETMNELMVQGEKAKIMLTNRTETDITILCEEIRETYTITRELFEELTQDLIERTWTLTESTLVDADLSWRHVTDVLLVGGSTRMPMVHDYIEATIGKPPLKGVDPDQAVALGATIKANLADESKAQEPKFSLASSRKVTDVMSHSLGMIAINKSNTRYINSIILRKNQSLPIERKRSYQLQTHPTANNSLDVYVTQGESNKPSECTIIGKYMVSSIPHQRDGRAKIDVIYGYDANGVIRVSAFDTIEKRDLLVEREDIDDNLQWLHEAPKEEEVIEQKVELSVVIAIDLSYSMVNEPIREAQNATREFINKMDLDHTSISLVGFADQAATFIPLTNDRGQLLDKVSTYEQSVLNCTLGAANDAEPFTEAQAQLQHREGHKYILVLTDGLWRDRIEAINRAKACHDSDIEVIAIGFGGADEQFLNEIATTSENALFTNETELVSSFSKIAQELSDSNSLQMKKKSGFLNIFK